MSTESERATDVRRDGVAVGRVRTTPRITIDPRKGLNDMLPDLTRGEAADDWLDARRRYGPDSAEADQAADVLNQLLTLPENLEDEA